MIRRAIASLVLCLIILVAGIYLGGHPDRLPGFARNAFVGDGDTRVVKEAIDDVHDSYYRQIPRKELANDSIKGIVASLGDRFSNYFSPEEYAKFRDQQRGEFAGVGISVVEDTARPEDRPGLRQLAGQPRQDRRGRRHHRRRRHAAGGPQQHGLGRAHPGPDGDEREADAPARRRHPRRDARARGDLRVARAVARSHDWAASATPCCRWPTSARPRTASWPRLCARRCRTTPAASCFDLRGNPGGLVSEAQLVASEFLTDGKIVTTKGALGAHAHAQRDGRPDRAQDLPIVVLVDRNSASRGRDRRRRPAGPPPRRARRDADVRQGRLPGGHRRSPTAARWTSPSASTSLPSGRNLGGKGTETGAGLTPDVQARTTRRPQRRADEALPTRGR